MQMKDQEGGRHTFAAFLREQLLEINPSSDCEGGEAVSGTLLPTRLCDTIDVKSKFY